MLRGHLHTKTLIASTLIALSCGCSDDDGRPGAIGDCVGDGCGSPGGGGNVTPGPEAGADVESEAAPDVEVTVANLSGTVVSLSDPIYLTTLPFSGFGYVRVPTASGDEQVPFDAGTGFTATDVVTGPGWFTVVPDSSLAGTGAVTTYAYLRVPEGGSTAFEIPIVDQTVLSTIYAGFLQPTTVREDAAQVIVVFERDGVAVTGIRLVDHPTSEAIAYDTGAGVSTEATETGINGIAILVNVTGTGPLRWTTEGGETESLSVVQVPGQASFLRIEVPG